MDDQQPALRPMPWLVLPAAAYLVAEALTLVYGRDLQELAGLPLEWNWMGKAGSIALSCLLLACSPWLRQNVGLTRRQAPGSRGLSLSWFACCLAIGTFFGLVGPPVPRSAETLAYQVFMPGISEELAYRGIALALLERAFGHSPMSCRLRFGPAGAITSLVFAMGHLGYYFSLPLGIAVLGLAIILGSAAIDTLVRTRSGSLLWPVLCHGAWDGGWALVGMLQAG